MAIAPWLDINPVRDYTSAMEAGVSAGQRQRQLNDAGFENFQRLNLSRQQLADQENQNAAANALRSQGLMANHQLALQKLSQANASIALHQAALQQANAALQEKNQIISDRETRLDSAADELNKWRSGELDAKNSKLGEDSFINVGGKLYKVNKQTGGYEEVADNSKPQPTIPEKAKAAVDFENAKKTIEADGVVQDPSKFVSTSTAPAYEHNIGLGGGTITPTGAAAALKRPNVAPQSGSDPAAALGDGGAAETRKNLESIGAIPKGDEPRAEQGGYKIGKVYKGGLKYIGGDPNDKASWEQQ